MLVVSGRWIGTLSVVAVASATRLVACVELKDPLPAPPTETSPESGRADGGAGDDAATDGSAGDDANASATQDAGFDSGTGTAKVESLTVGENVACVVFAQGVMRCWGSSLLAGGGATKTTPPSPIPIRASDGGGFLTGVAEVSASYRHACARLLAGGFACWGFNNEYQLGDFTRDINQSTAITPFARHVKDASTAGPLLEGPVNLAGVGRVSGGVFYSAAIVDGAVLTWGYISAGANGVLGRATVTQSEAVTPKAVLAIAMTPPPVDDRLLGAKNVGLARTHGCASLQNNTIACWGDNTGGRLGIGTGAPVTDGRPHLVAVPDSTGLLRVATGDSSSCAVTAMGRVRCWGYNNLGQAGKDPVGSSSPMDASLDVRIDATTVLSGVLDVGVGDGFACALTDTSGGGRVYCWGTGAGAVLGDGATVARARALPVASALAPTKTDLQGARLLAVGKSSACVVVGNRDVRCWGRGPIGERGASSTTSTIPRPVDDL